jgi:hypothetical protein
VIDPPPPLPAPVQHDFVINIAPPSVPLSLPPA